jgi:hypothetical protein
MKYTHHVVPLLPRIDPKKLRVGEWIKRDGGVWLSVERVTRVNKRVKVIGKGVRGEVVEAWADECREGWDPDKHMGLARKEALKERNSRKSGSLDENGDPNGNVKE